MIDSSTDAHGALKVLFTLIRWGLGWRYVFSSSFRAEVHADWHKSKRWMALTEVVFGTLLFASANYVVMNLVIDLSGPLYEKLLVHLNG